MPKSFDLVIFDCDGVLIDSEMLSCESISAALASHGIHMSVAECHRAFVGATLGQARAYVMERFKCDLPESLPDDIRARDREIFKERLQAVSGIHEALDHLPTPRCVASNGSLGKMEFTLGLTQLYDKLAPHIFSAEMVKEGKPEPDLYLLAAEKMGVAPERCVVVEDSLVGITAAHRAGMRVLAFAGATHGGDDHITALEESPALLIFEDMHQLPSLLKDLE